MFHALPIRSLPWNDGISPRHWVDVAAMVGVMNSMIGPTLWRHPLYTTWRTMQERCYRKQRHNFKDYGGRGITVCERWRNSFAAFLGDMGPKPSPRHTLDRINNDGNYEPGNCRWATPEEQAANRRPLKTSGAFVGGKRPSRAVLGRSLRGEEVNLAKLTAEQVLEIRAIGREVSGRVLAQRFGVTQRAVDYARTGVTWKHLPGALRGAA